MKYVLNLLFSITLVNNVYAIVNYGSFEDYEQYYDIISEQNIQVDARIVSQPKVFEVNIGDSIILPCDASENISDYTHQWKRAELWSQSNIKLFHNGSLKVNIMSQKDKGYYICELRIKHQTHKVTHEVVVKPCPVTSSNGTCGSRTRLLEMSPKTALEIPVFNNTYLLPTKKQDELKMNSVISENQKQKENVEFSSSITSSKPVLTISKKLHTNTNLNSAKAIEKTSSNHQPDKKFNLNFILHSIISNKQHNKLLNGDKTKLTYYLTSAQERSFGFSSHPKVSLGWILTVSAHFLGILLKM